MSCSAKKKRNTILSSDIFASRFPPQHRMNANYAINNLLAINLTNSRPRNRSSRVVTWSKRPHTPPLNAKASPPSMNNDENLNNNNIIENQI